MSDLERESAQFLEPLILGRPTILTSEQQAVVARWIWKTSLMYEHGLFRKFAPHLLKNKQPVFRTADRVALYEKLPPPDGTFVYMGHFSDQWAAINDVPQYSSWSAGKGLPIVKGLKHTLAIGQLALQICAFRWPDGFIPPDAREGFGLRLQHPWTHILLQVHPSLSAVGWPPPSALNVPRLIDLANRKL
jgi:hypothetical protein